jgi:hypothetical protein
MTPLWTLYQFPENPFHGNDLEWFRARLTDSQSVLYSAMNRQGRFDVHDGLPVGRATGGPVDQSGRGLARKGNGRKMLFLVTEELFETSASRRFDAL